MLIMLLTIGSLSSFLILLNFLISSMNKDMREKNSTFECGFDLKSSARLPFSMHFFLIALIFLIFDVEITLLVPIPFAWGLMNFMMFSILLLIVLLLLLLGTLVEWVEGSLEWYT